MARTLKESDLIFPTQSMNLSSTLHSLKRSALSITNRLNSITSDSLFVQSVAEAYRLPLVANERCGSWYISPEKKVESVYFKSTDGHMNEWGFNLRRLNLQVFGTVQKFGGCVIIDSTRRGKSMPDALSKTVPIWCCVMNRAIFEDKASHELHTPPQAVSASENAQIDKRIDSFVKQFLDVCKPDIPSLRQQLGKPLRPLWVIQGSSLPESPPTFPDFHAIVLCTASRRVHGGEGSEGGYIQGAADDHEAWSHGLTPKLFWENKDSLLSTNEEELPGVIKKLIEEEEASRAVPILIRPTSNLSVSSSQNLDISPFSVVISCTPSPVTTTNPEHLETKRYLHLPLAAGKLGSRDLRLQLQRLAPFIESLSQDNLLTQNILVCCPTGKDLSVGVALAILCLYTTDEGQISNRVLVNTNDKPFIKQRLTWITTSSPTLNPSRATLNAINTFLMPDPVFPNKPGPAKDTVSKFVLVDANGNPIQESPEATDKADEASTTHTSDSATDVPNHKTLSTSADAVERPLILPTNIQAPTSSPQRHISQTLFASLQNANNPWTFARSLISKLPDHPSGTVNGTATFSPFHNRSDALLYSEQGEFITDNGLRFIARRKYVYILNEGTNDSEPYISVHFHEEDKLGELGGLFVEMGGLEFTEGGVASLGVWTAKNREQHLCGEDLYSASWKIEDGLVKGDEVDSEGTGNPVWWEVRYDVKGPKKDYVSETRYLR